MKNALISIKPEYVKKILSGSKTIEIRNRTVNLAPGSRLWIYSTLPKGCIEAVAVIKDIKFGSPSEIWNQYHKQIDVSESVFHSYVKGSKIVSAIFLQDVIGIGSKLTLNYIRSEIKEFHPPQFLKYIHPGNPLLCILENNARGIKTSQVS